MVFNVFYLHRVGCLGCLLLVAVVISAAVPAPVAILELTITVDYSHIVRFSRSVHFGSRQIWLVSVCISWKLIEDQRSLCLKKSTSCRNQHYPIKTISVSVQPWSVSDVHTKKTKDYFGCQEKYRWPDSTDCFQEVPDFQIQFPPKGASTSVEDSNPLSELLTNNLWFYPITSPLGILGISKPMSWRQQDLKKRNVFLLALFERTITGEGNHKNRGNKTTGVNKDLAYDLTLYTHNVVVF